MTGLEFVGFRVNGKRIRGLASKGAELARTVASGRATDEVVADRMAICEACEFLRRERGGIYCGACGCPEWGPAELNQKLRFAGTKCPKGKFLPVRR